MKIITKNSIIIIVLVIVATILMGFNVIQIYTGEVASLVTIGDPHFVTQEYSEFVAEQLFEDYQDTIYAFNKTTLNEYKAILSKPEVHYLYSSSHSGLSSYLLPNGIWEYNHPDDIWIRGIDIAECMENRQPIKMAFFPSCNVFRHYSEDEWEPNSHPSPDPNYDGLLIEDELRKGKLENTAVFGFRTPSSGIAPSIMGKIIDYIFEDGMTTGEAFYTAVDLNPEWCKENLRMSGDTNLRASDSIPEYDPNANGDDDDDDTNGSIPAPSFEFVLLFVALIVVALLVVNRRK